MKIIITKEDLDDVERAVDRSCGALDHDQSTRELWSKIRLCIEKGLELEYHEEYTELTESEVAVGMITQVESCPEPEEKWPIGSGPYCGQGRRERW